MANNTAQIILQSLSRPASWLDGPYPSQLKNELEKLFETEVYPLNSGRSSLYLLLKAYGIGPGDEVILQAYTCNAVPNPILWSGAKPVYADIEEQTLSVDPKKIEEKINSSTKAIIVQHTFGRAGKIKEIVKIAKEHKLVVIEDCAHALGAFHGEKLLGKFGHAAILSFGREKVISSLSGGAIVLNDKRQSEAVGRQVALAADMSRKQIAKELNNYFTWRLLLRRIYFRAGGELLLKFLNRSDFFNVVTSRGELSGEKPAWYPAKMPNLFAEIALNQFSQLAELNTERKRVAEIYYERITNKSFRLLRPHSGIYLRFVTFHPEAKKILEISRKKGLWFGNWYDSPVYPGRVNFEKLGYKQGSCPIAEKLASETLNLPLHLGMTEGEITAVVNFINSYGN